MVFSLLLWHLWSWNYSQHDPRKDFPIWQSLLVFLEYAHKYGTPFPDTSWIFFSPSLSYLSSFLLSLLHLTFFSLIIPPYCKTCLEKEQTATMFPNLQWDIRFLNDCVFLELFWMIESFLNTYFNGKHFLLELFNLCVSAFY